MAGSLIAADAVGIVHSGAAVTASISPAATVIENDTALTSGTIPSVPASSAPAILTDAAAAKAKVLADLAALDAVFAQSKGDAALVLTETADKISATRAAVQNSVTEAKLKLQKDLATAGWLRLLVNLSGRRPQEVCLVQTRNEIVPTPVSKL